MGERDETTPSAAQGARELPRDYSELAPTVPEEGLDLIELFGSNAEIEMEIGFGRGMFLVQRAEAAPAACLLGFEIKRKWAHRVSERCRRRGLQARVRAFGGDVRIVLPSLRPAGSVARVFMHFPDPWWKKRHAKRRLVGDDVLDELARLLRPGGEFFVQTDVEERAETYRERLAAHPAFGAERVEMLDHNPYAAVSNRERRAIEDGLPVHRVLARRR